MKKTIYMAFGSLAMLLGSAILLWILYNLFVEKQEKFEFRGKAVIMPLIFLGVGFAMFKKGWSNDFS